MHLSTRKTHSYRRALKLWMGYVADGHQASLLDVPAVTALGWLLDSEMGHLDDFLKRYRVVERDRRRGEVRQVVLLWLAELAI